MGLLINGKLEPCHNCGQNKSYLFDGYVVGDRIMEGVIFEYSYDGTNFVVEPTADSKDYLSSKGFNISFWNDAIKEYLEKHDGYDSVQCSKCLAWFC